MRLVAGPIDHSLTNAQWAWEFLRRSPSYRSGYQAWFAMCQGLRELDRDDEAFLLQSLDALGVWRGRYEPWIAAGLKTGKQFVRMQRVEESHLSGDYVEADLHLDPMQFLIREWLDPETAPLPLGKDLFDCAGALDLRVVRRGTPEFAAACGLGIIDFLDAERLLSKPGRGHVGLAAFVEGAVEDVDPDRKVDRSVETLHGFPMRPVPWELSSNLEGNESDPKRWDELSQFLRALQARSAPVVDRHDVLHARVPGGVRSLDLNVNLQFDVSRPLEPQLAAAFAILQAQQRAVEPHTDRTFLPAFDDVQVVNVNGTYATYLALLDAFDVAEEGHGRLAAAIRKVAREDLHAKDPRYDTLAKAFARAQALRDGGYRSLAFAPARGG